jgi:hypothetical protein
VSDIIDKKEWGKYRERELAAVLPILEKLGFQLEQEQPHLGGEKYLAQAVTTASGKKIILLGRNKQNNKRVVIKITSDPQGIHELEYERKCRLALQKIKFAYQIFFSPQEILFVKKRGFVISVQEFLESGQSFLERPVQEQFSLTLKAFKAQESSHATAYGHKRFVKKTFGEKTAGDYIQMFNLFKKEIKKIMPERSDLYVLFEKTEQFLIVNSEITEQYCGFLTHTDFVPHNFRVIDDKIYLLDHSSIRFGNKYEGWARFLNFIALYNPALEQALTEYVHDNRTEEELLSLQLMRVYRLGELIYYYAKTLPKTSGNLFLLNNARIDFWSKLLQAVLKNKSLDKNIIEEYKKTRDSLRDEKEKQRQKILY